MAATPIELRAAVRPAAPRDASPRWDHVRELPAVRLTEGMRERRHTAPNAPSARAGGGRRRGVVGALLAGLVGVGIGAALMAPAGAPPRSRIIERVAVGVDLVAEGPAASLRTLAGQVVACHEAAPDAPDEVTAHAVVEASGALGAISLTPLTAAGEALRSCLTARASRLRFPPLAGPGAALISLRVAR